MHADVEGVGTFCFVKDMSSKNKVCLSPFVMSWSQTW